MPVFFSNFFFLKRLLLLFFLGGGKVGMNMSTILRKSIDYQTTKNPLQSLCDNEEQK